MVDTPPPSPRAGERGTVVIEFWMVMMILFILTLGMIEMSNLLSFHRRLNMATQVMIDIIARSPDPENADTDELSKAVQLTLRPFNASIKAAVAYVRFDEDGNPLMSHADGTFRLSVAGGEDIQPAEMADEAAGLGAGDDAAIIGRVTATYVPILQPTKMFPFLTASFDISSTKSQRPRPSF